MPDAAAPMVDISLSREFPHPIDDVYAWLTDYQDDDPAIAGTVIEERSVIERHPDRVVMRVKNVIAGKPMKGLAEVRLSPKEYRYEARSLEGDKGAILYTYQLTSLGPSRTRLDVSYKTRVRRFTRRLQVRLATPIIRRQLHRMWDGFTEAMARDLR